ncbi:hypothetical protein KC909_05420, partial [Candidatus Dojkabacteria bacterium]|nr:hypothetical protein [Candidatus Dojkabacteria bacterium]
KKSEFGLSRKDIYKVLAIAISIIFPWHLYMYVTHGREFIDAYLGYHIIERSLVTIEEHDEWRFFYFEVFYNLKVNILAGLTSLSVIYLLITDRKSDIFRISLAIILGIFTIITLMDTKLAWYVLPVYPFQSILIGYAIGNTENMNIKYSLAIKLVCFVTIIAGIYSSIQYIHAL